MIQTNRTLDCEGLACPMPVVRTKKAIDEMNAGEVLEVRATDKGSVADLQSWANRIGHQYIGLKEEGGIFHHFLRKSAENEIKLETRHPNIISNEELNRKLAVGGNFKVLDVREPAEYSFNRIPGAMSIPMGELEGKLDLLSKDEEYLVVCRTGTRSDVACQLLSARGYSKVTNVVPGMSVWEGPVERDEQPTGR
ncbi:sulfurtransferase TusA family protein [Cohnella sp. LGH]|uniref:sulfurtransferase TusA family protein n=1 Tax=Cohnella sp. LGH TaxID=1619153 RepID=UPI001ADC509A|nr:sulfurtransferase TusA family protein [Cohnella sp. LGH]QTH46757.1 sulfurtransferase TusA family protein [Cohnella sp. LGH]